MQPRRITRGASALLSVWLLGGTLVACSSDDPPAPNTADRTFLQEMIPHHQRALEIAAIAETRGSDARVRSFGVTVIREQTPELQAMQRAAKSLGLNYVTGAADARDRVSDAELGQLNTLTGASFDRRYIQLNISSETGAYEMARTELAGGRYAPAKKVAKGISYSPGQIHRLGTLLTSLG